MPSVRHFCMSLVSSDNFTGDCSTSEHWEGATFVPLCNHCKVSVSECMPHHLQASAKNCQKYVYNISTFVRSCLNALRMLQKYGHLPSESSLFREYAGWVITVIADWGIITLYRHVMWMSGISRQIHVHIILITSLIKWIVRKIKQPY